MNNRKRAVPTVSPMLEHFARLAANVAGTSVAIVGVLGRSTDNTPTLAAWGLPQDQSAKILEIDRILGYSPTLTVVPDLTQDQRFARACLVAGHPGLRFLAYQRLLSAGGERVGFICVLDEVPRPALTDPQSTALGDLAGMIIADRRREQRHRHLMHVANRALRVDRMLRLVSDAASCADALTSLLEELCRFHDAAIGRIWQLIRPDQPMQEISRFDRDDQGQDDDPKPAETKACLNNAVAGAIRRNEPHATRFSANRTPQPDEAPIAPGVVSQVCVPISVQQQRFGILLAFTAERSDLDEVMADIASLADTIRPALFRKVTEERIRYVAHHDNLTQLPNRLMFHQGLERTLGMARCSDQKFAVLFMDLDGFKSVNDTSGHEVGDKLLVSVAQRLRDNLREDDIVARMGGDEFAIIQPLGGQPSAATALAQRLLTTIGQPFESEGRRSVIGASIGIAIYPHDGDSADALLRNADIALYRAKEAGRNTYRLFSPDMQAGPDGGAGLEPDLRDAVEERQFTLKYQPVCDTSSLQVVGFEALLRWNHPKHGPIRPDTFIPIAEASGLIIPLGRWVLEKACAEAATWDPPVCLSVNLSPLQFRQPDLPEQIAAVLKRTGLPAERLDLEVTEGLLLDESDLVLQTTQRLQKQGVRITLDDFGTAYASLSYLRRFRFDRIKIDRSFIRSICEDDSAIAIVEAILALGDRLNLSVVAEGVEDEEQLDVLRKLGCRLVQGYLSGRPIPDHEARSLLHQQRNLQPRAKFDPVLTPLSDWALFRQALRVPVPADGPEPYEQRQGSKHRHRNGDGTRATAGEEEGHDNARQGT